MTDGVRSVVEEWMGRGVYPGAAWAMGGIFGERERVEYGWAGRMGDGLGEVGEGTLWDLASLTKVISTTSAAMVAVSRGVVDVEDLVSKWVPETKLGEARVRDLLLHESGLRAYDSLGGHVRSAQEGRIRILTGSPVSGPGERSVYSCLGFVTLQTVLERATGLGLGVQFGELAVDFGGWLGYRPGPGEVGRVAATGATEGWRRSLAAERGEEWGIGGFVRGLVHDPVAYVLGGVSGNAGLFGDIRGVAGYCLALLRDLRGEAGRFGGLVREWGRRQGRVLGSTRGLGFDTKSESGSSAGRWFGEGSFGHTGFTGTCLWVDPGALKFAVFLTNRVHMGDEIDLIKEARPAFFESAWVEMAGWRG